MIQPDDLAHTRSINASASAMKSSVSMPEAAAQIRCHSSTHARPTSQLTTDRSGNNRSARRESSHALIASDATPSNIVHR